MILLREKKRLYELRRTICFLKNYFEFFFINITLCIIIVVLESEKNFNKI